MKYIWGGKMENNLIIMSKFNDLWEVSTPNTFYIRAKNINDLLFDLRNEILKINNTSSSFVCRFISDKDNYMLKKNKTETSFSKKELDYLIVPYKSKHKEKEYMIWKINKCFFNEVQLFFKKISMKKIRIIPFSYDLDNSIENGLEIYITNSVLILLLYENNILICERHYHLDYTLIEDETQKTPIVELNYSFQCFFDNINLLINAYIREKCAYDIKVGKIHTFSNYLKEFIQYIIRGIDLSIISYD